MFKSLSVGSVALALAVAMIIVVVVGGATIARAADTPGITVFKQVMRECKHQETSDAALFIIVPGLMGAAPTNVQIETYVASKTQYAKSAGSSSKCWTFERWQIYAREELKNQQRMINEANKELK